MKERQRRGSPSRGDDGAVTVEVPGLKDDVEEEEEFTSMWRKLGLQPDRGQVNLVMENRRKIQGRVEVIWQELQLAIIETIRDQGRMIYSEEEHQLKQELALVTNMSLILEQRLELLQFLAMRVELGSEY